jgi:selenide,water dikinase
MSARIPVGSAPLFDGVRGLVEEGIVPGGTQRNLAAIEEFTSWAEDVSDVDRLILSDAQTSGGLLIAVDAARADDLIAALQRQETPVAVVIGEIVAGAAGTIEVR